ncbi:DUF3618 domain-containing protein [Tenggerimyces flavus]|uniref:DUF3618 domain-containing protein n=1 Tax=Tenggerimyces flavus TaxID=1708749 RepID=A0ABV7YNN5_9ACTN|nr:DUF3618 domain-containing protein [Tenggerimyces flavus]MBM7786398.1 hypothetical protein [Tenggerimyces flavus]
MSDETAPVRSTAPDPSANGHAGRSRTPAQIEAELAATRERLAATVDSLVDRVHPKTLAARGVASAKDAVVDEYGGLRTERLVKFAAVAGGAIVALIVLRRIFRRR